MKFNRFSLVTAALLGLLSTSQVEGIKVGQKNFDDIDSLEEATPSSDPKPDSDTNLVTDADIHSNEPVARSSSQMTDMENEEKQALNKYEYDESEKKVQAQSLAQANIQSSDNRLTSAGWNIASTIKPAGMKYNEAWDQPLNLLPDLEWIAKADGYGSNIASVDFPSLRIKTLRKGTGELCMLNDWATIQYKAYITVNPGEDPQEIHNTRKNMAGDGPFQFRVGNFQVSKCWDIAMQQAKKGQLFKLLCPAGIDKGGSINNFRTSNTAWIKEGQDIVYEIEVLRCDPQLTSPRDEPVVPKKCIFITLEQNTGQRLALAVAEQDAYYPRKTGLYNVDIEKWDGPGSKDVNQMWWYDDVTHNLHSKAKESDAAVLFEGFNKNLVVFRYLGRDNQKFGYNGATRFWRNDFSKRAVAVNWGAFTPGQNAVTESVDENNTILGTQWDIHYCDNNGAQ